MKGCPHCDHIEATERNASGWSILMSILTAAALGVLAIGAFVYAGAEWRERGERIECLENPDKVLVGDGGWTGNPIECEDP